MIEEGILYTWWNNIWIQAAVIIVVSWLIQRIGDIFIRFIIRRTVRSTHIHHMSSVDERKRQDTLVSVSSVILKIMIGMTAGYALIRLFIPDVDLAPIFASAGIVGIALGFGAQTIVKDFLAGLFIIIENQYRVGDVVEIEGSSGTVERITLRCTILRDITGSVHYIPNGNITHSINKTMDYGKVYFTLAIHPDADIDHVTHLINKVGRRLATSKEFKDQIIDPPQFHNLGAFNDIAIEVNILGKTEAGAQWSVTSAMKQRLLNEFAKNNIELSQYSDIKLPR